MARKTFNVLFFIKKARLLKNGEAPVCMRITVNGCMVDVLVKRSCPVNLWNQAKENSKGKDRMSVELNHYLEITRSRIHQIYRELESTGKTITALYRLGSFLRFRSAHVCFPHALAHCRFQHSV